LGIEVARLLEGRGGSLVRVMGVLCRIVVVDSFIEKVLGFHYMQLIWLLLEMII
jgi:hypothetical protein